MDRTEEEVREQVEWTANWTRRFIELAQEPVRAKLARANKVVAKQEEIIRDLRIKLDSNACVIAAYKAYIAAHEKDNTKLREALSIPGVKKSHPGRWIGTEEAREHWPDYMGRKSPNIVAGRGIREATEEAGPLHLHSTKDEPPAVTIGEVEEWKRRSAEARLSRLDALLASKDVPEGLRRNLGTLTPVLLTDYAEAAWRWFREQLR